MKRVLFFLSLLALLSAAVIIPSGCASIVPPTGGDRDSLPPLLRNVTPKDSSLRFNSRTITFSFNEYLGDLTDIQGNVLISPTPERMPEITTHLKTVNVRFRDSLEANTTYSISFGNAIKDYNEGNVLKDFTYIFSTGDALDSLELTGKVVLAETGKTDSTLIVMLHTSPEDSVVVNKDPRYIARLNREGNFRFQNLPPGTFYVYALKEEGGQRRYLSPKTLFGFYDTAVVVSTQNQPLTLFAYKEEEAAVAVTPNLTIGNNRGANTANERRLRFETNVTSGVFDQQQSFVFSFQTPLKNFDSSKVKIYTDSFTKNLPITSFTRDTGDKKVTMGFDWKPDVQYSLVLDKEFAQDTAGRQLLKTDTLIFRTKKESDYGSLKLKFKNLDLDKNPVLLFLSGDKLVKSVPLLSADLFLKRFTPGDYELRILFDRNKNGKWDPGIFFGKRQQPELAMPIERKLTIKTNWDNEVEISL